MPISIPLIVAVATGGAIGALARFLLVSAADHFSISARHWMVFMINATGCLLLGMLTGHLLARDADPDHWHHFATVGLLGAFTTYSTFALDAVRLFQHGKPIEACAYLAASVIVGLAAAAVGMVITSPSIP